MKRLFSVFAVFFILALPLNSYAIIPVVAYAVETGVPIAAELIVANAERSIISRIGTNIAQNPVLWASAVQGLAEAVVTSYRAGPISNPTKYEIPATLSTPVPKPPPVTVTAPPPGWTGPAFFNGPAIYCFLNGNPSIVGPVGRSTAQELVTAYQQLCPGGDLTFEVDAGVTHGYLRGGNMDGAYLCTGSTNCDGWVEVSISCPPGAYFHIEGVCKGEVVDGTYRFLRGSVGFYPDLADPDWNGQVPSGWLSDGHSITISGTDADGKPIRILFNPTAAGTQITVDNESTNSLGSPTTTQGFLEIAGDGQVASSSLQKTQNAISGSSSGAALEVAFPDDYARDASVSGITDELFVANSWLDSIELNTFDIGSKLTTTNSRLNTGNTHLGNIKTALTDAGTAPDDPTFADHTSASFKASFDDGNPLSGFMNFNLPAHQSECPIAEFVALDHQFVWDSHCTFGDQFRADIQALFAIIYVLAAFYIVLEA